MPKTQRVQKPKPRVAKVVKTVKAQSTIKRPVEVYKPWDGKW